MAFTSPDYEEKYVAPSPKHIKSLSKFALVDADGDTDGVQWYVMPTAEIVLTNLIYTAEAYGYFIKADGVDYVTTVKPAIVTNGGVYRLAADLPPEVTWTRGKFAVDPRYYSDKNSEIDFVLQYGTEIIPVEVKGGEDKLAPSFKKYIKDNNPKYAIRYSKRGYRKDGEITNIPLYLAGKTREMLS